MTLDFRLLLSLIEYSVLTGISPTATIVMCFQIKVSKLLGGTQQLVK